MASKTPTPTLAELRKLAKRKGLRVVDRGFGPDDTAIAPGRERESLPLVVGGLLAFDGLVQLVFLGIKEAAK